MNARYEAETKKGTVNYELAGKTYELAMTLHVIAELQEQKGDVGDALADAATSVKKLVEVYLLIFNDAIDNWNEDHPEDRRERFTADLLSRRLSYMDVERLTEALFVMVGKSMPKVNTAGADVTPEMRDLLEAENLPDDEKNAAAGDA